MKVFFSYARSDAEFALKLAKDLKSAGVDVWLDQLDINPGVRWDDAVENALKACPRFLIILSPASVGSHIVMDEVSFAIENNKEIVPVLYKNCDIPFRLKRLQYIDFTRNYDEEITELRSALAGNSPSFPHLKKNTGIATWTKRTKIMLAAFILLGTLSGVWLLTKPPISDFNQSERNAPLPREPIAPRASDKDARPKKDIIGTQESSMKTLPPGANGVNNPLSLEFGVTYNITLEKNEESYFRLSSPADELKIILDMRLANNKHSNLQSTLSILDQDGGVIQNRAIVFNEIDVGYRKETSLSLKQATILGFKLLNTSNEANFWLTIFKKPDSQLVPFFGELVPKPLGIGEGGSGRLAAGEYAY